MKKIFIVILFLLPFFCNAQYIEGDTLFINDSTKLAVGESLQLGYGSNMSTRDFNFIYTSSDNILISQTFLGASYSGLKMEIDGFKQYHSKRTGDKYIVILRGGNIVKYWCDIMPAIALKEVILN